MPDPVKLAAPHPVDVKCMPVMLLLTFEVGLYLWIHL